MAASGTLIEEKTIAERSGAVKHSLVYGLAGPHEGVRLPVAACIRITWRPSNTASWRC
jgi:hypothetical protein